MICSLTNRSERCIVIACECLWSDRLHPRSSFLGMSIWTSLFRPVCAGVLCCIALLGHAPAWMHLATCSDSGCANSGLCAAASVQEDDRSHTCCGESHTHGAGYREATDSRKGDGSDDRTSHHHDSDHCVVCYHLGGVVGESVVVMQPVCIERCIDQAVVFTELPPFGTKEACLFLRGPPMVSGLI